MWKLHFNWTRRPNQSWSGKFSEYRQKLGWSSSKSSGLKRTLLTMNTGPITKIWSCEKGLVTRFNADNSRRHARPFRISVLKIPEFFGRDFAVFNNWDLYDDTPKMRNGSSQFPQNVTRQVKQIVSHVLSHKQYHSKNILFVFYCKQHGLSFQTEPQEIIEICPLAAWTVLIGYFSCCRASAVTSK